MSLERCHRFLHRKTVETSRHGQVVVPATPVCYSRPPPGSPFYCSRSCGMRQLWLTAYCHRRQALRQPARNLTVAGRWQVRPATVIRPAEGPGGHAPVLPTPFHRKKMNRLPELIFTTRNVIKVGPDFDDVRHQPLRNGLLRRWTTSRSSATIVRHVT